MKKLIQLIFVGILSVVTFASCGGEDVIATENNLGGVHGVAIDAENQEPMRGVNVQLCKESGSIIESTVTYDDGHFEFTKVAPGSYTIVISSTKYPNVKYDFAVESGRTASFDVPMGLHVNPYMPIYITNARWENWQGLIYIFMDIIAPESHKFEILEQGLYYSTKENPMSTGRKAKIYGGDTYTFIGDQTIMYYVQAYFKDSNGNTYLSEIIRITLVTYTPEVETSQVYKSNGKVYCEGEVKHKGNPVYSERGFIISTEHKSPMISDVDDSETKKYVVEGDELIYKLNFSEYMEEKEYYVRAYATNEIGTGYGKTIKFGGLDWYILGNLMVQKADLGRFDWNTANQLCKDSRLGGFSDWRLPTIDELKIIFAKGWLFKFDHYWSCSSSGTDYYWRIDGDNGVTSSSYATKIFCVKAVRTITE